MASRTIDGALPADTTGASVAVSLEEPLAEEQRYRAGAYGVLAALLRDIPESTVLEQVARFADVESKHDELEVSMSMLGLAARSCDPSAVDDEYHALFIGLGRGELLPYGSWYLTGFLMEKPLGVLRDDLAALGFVKDPDVCEPEDHVAALCEVMAIMINDGVSQYVQKRFFDAHIGTWCDRFFADLSEAKAAVFYRAVGRFGAAFISLEQRYLSMQI